MKPHERRQARKLTQRRIGNIRCNRATTSNINKYMGIGYDISLGSAQVYAKLAQKSVSLAELYLERLRHGVMSKEDARRKYGKPS